MMNNRQIDDNLKKHRQRTGLTDCRVIYLEGDSDPDLFFGLIGVNTQEDNVHQEVLVLGLSSKTDSGAGNKAVQR
jgi:hypothetical protein